MATRKKQPAKAASEAKAAPAPAKSDAPDARALDRHIGATAHALRLQRRLTIADLARQAGLSPGMLSKIENSQVSPSLDSLWALSRALGVEIAELMSGFESTDGEAQFVPKQGGLEVVRRGTKKGHTYHLLYANRGPHKPFEPFLVTLTDASEVFPAFKHEGLEFLHILEGRIEYRHGSQTFMLGPGDSLTFEGKVPHGPEALVKLPIVMLSVIVYSTPG